MRIALIAPFHEFGGSEHQILLLLRGLQRQCVEVVFFHLGIRSPELLGALEAIPGCEHAEIRCRSIKNPLLFAVDARQVAMLLRQHKCELAHCWNYTGHIIGGVASWLARIPCIFSVGGLDPWKRTWQLPFYRLLNRLADIFVFQSVAECDTVRRREWIPLMRTRIVPNGLDHQRFHDVDHVAAKHEIRRELGLCPSIPLILSVGSLRPIKGHDVLIESVRIIRTSRPDLRFHVLIVGDGPLRGAYERSARELPISFAGFRKDVELIYAAADVYCQPSRSEGLPNAVVEAMCCGLPIVASEVGAMADLVSADNGRRCRAEDPAELASQLCELLDHQEAWPSMAAASVRSSARFSAERMVDSYISVYRHALSKE